MRLARLALALAFATALAACGASIATINERPDAWYQKTVTITGQIARQQTLADGVLLEVADRRSRRILVRTSGPVDAVTGDWVRVTGLLVPESRVGDVTLYDVIQAEDVQPTGPPRLPDIR